MITGASSGVGAALAGLLAAPGIRLELVARRADHLEQVADTCRAAGAMATTWPLDLRDLDAVTAYAQELSAAQVPDVVVCNAGYSIRRPLLQQADRLHDHTRLAGVNWLGHVALLLPLLPGMASRGSGVVVGVTSASAWLPVPGWAAYASSKAAFSTWLRTASVELAPHGVRVSEVALGLVDTPMAHPTYPQGSRWASSPQRAAALVARAVEHPRTVRGPWWTRPAWAVSSLTPGVVGSLARRGSRLGR